MKYRKKPVVIEAVKVIYAEMTGKGPERPPFDELPPWLLTAIDAGDITLSSKVWRNGVWQYNARDYAVINVNTLEGVMEAGPGDYLVRGIKGELYPCKPDIFEATYEPA